MGNFCSSDAAAAIEPPSPQRSGKGDKKSKKATRAPVRQGAPGETELIGVTENPMVASRRKKRESSAAKEKSDDEETKEAPSTPTRQSSGGDASAAPGTAVPAQVPSTTQSPEGTGSKRGSLFGGKNIKAAEIEGRKKREEEEKLAAAAAAPPPIIVENPGKFGWLYRENEQYEWEVSKLGRSTEEQWVKKWVSIADRKLYYCSVQPTDGVKCLADGYWDLRSPNCEVKLKHIDKLISGRGRNDKVGNYCFQVRDDGKRGEGMNDDKFAITFAAATDIERDEWMKVIKDAIGGFVHNPSSCSWLMITPVASSDDKVVVLPIKEGELKKLSSGGVLGIKTVSKRWFRLDGGEIRYYADEKRRPNALKRCFSLATSTLLDDHDPKIINIKMEDTGEFFKAEAATEATATEWKDKIRETLLMLRVQGAASPQTKRRLNLADVSSEGDEEKHGTAMHKFSVKSQDSIKLIQECIRNHFLLKTVKDTKALVDGMYKVVKLPGDTIIAEGTPGDLFYILETGLVDIVGLGGNALWGKVPDLKRTYDLSDPTSGAKRDFGEMALLNNSGRLATIHARHLCHLWALDRKTFRKVLADQERKAMMEKVAFLKGVSLFNGMSDTTMEKIADVMKLLTFEPKQRLFKQGDQGDYMYMILSGKASIQIASRKTGYFPKEVVQFGPGRFFGDQAIKDNAPRTATVVAVDKLQCWAIDRTNFLGLLGSMQQALEESIGVSILKNVKLLKTLNEKQLMTISRVLTSEEFPPGADIIKQGEDGEKFYMVSDGQVSIQINCVEVVKLGKSSFFGEGSLLKNEKRSATVTAVTPTKCLVLSRENFIKYLGPLDAIMKAEADKRKPPPEEPSFLSSLFSSKTLSVESVMKAASTSPTRNKLFDLDQLIRVRIIGRGTFSKAYLVRHTQNNKEFALKVLYKQTLHNVHQEKAVLQERDIMMKFDNPFITAIFATFQDARALYMVQQYIPGGDLWMLMKNNLLPKSRLGGISTEHATFYSSNALCAIAHMHDNDVIYRDLKPENLCIDVTGFLRVVDFGSAKKLAGDALTNTMVGTPEYIAPELVMSRGHNRAMDLWALGIMLYELLTGVSPFYNSNAVRFPPPRILSRLGSYTDSFPLYRSKSTRTLSMRPVS
jgi:cGMP-dependent protein kinase